MPSCLPLPPYTLPPHSTTPSCLLATVLAGALQAQGKLTAAEARLATMDARMQDAFARAARASEDTETIRGKLRAEHANVLRLTKQLETVHLLSVCWAWAWAWVGRRTWSLH